MHVGPTMLASHDKLWISLFFGAERCETVFIIIMKIIIMMIIIMMVIKRKKTTTNVTLLPRTLTLLNSCTPSPWHQMEECWHLPRVLAQGSASAAWGLLGSGDKCPSSSKKLMPLVILSVRFHLSKYIQENCLLLCSCLELLHCYTLMLQHRN